MKATMLSVDEGLTKFQGCLPRFKTIELGKMTLRDVKKTSITIGYEDEEIVFPHKAALRLRSLVGLDTRMTSQLSTSLQTQVFDELKKRGPEQIFARMRGNEVLKLEDEEEKTNIPYQLLVEKAVECAKPIGIANIVSNEKEVGIGFVTDQVHEAPTREGDTIHSGVYLSMNGGVTLSEYNLRLVCTNGMIGLDHRRRVSIPVEEFTAVCGVVAEDSKAFTDKFLTLTERRLGDSGALVGRLREMRYLNGQQINKVITRLAALKVDATEYDLINAITVLQHEKPNSLSWLITGGRIAGRLGVEHCSRCGA